MSHSRAGLQTLPTVGATDKDERVSFRLEQAAPGSAQPAETEPGVNPIQYSPFGSTCGDAQTVNQTCYLVPNTGLGGFGTLQVISALNGPRVLQFAFKWSF